MAKNMHASYSADYLKNHPMPNPTRGAIKRMTKILSIVGGLSLSGHKWAYCTRVLFLQGHLKLVSVEDKQRGDYRPSKDPELDLEDSESICTYDELASVFIEADGAIKLRIDRSTRSLCSGPSVPGAVFNLTGEWWRIWHYDDTVEKRLEEKLEYKADCLREAEEIARQLVRRDEIAELLLTDSYPQT